MSEFHYVCTLGEDGGVEAVDGPAAGLDVETILRDGLPPFNVALQIIGALCEILYIADEDGAVHGDIDTRDVFLDETGAVSIEGFGVERRTSRAPEGAPRGAATDLFGLGWVAYHLCSPHPLGDLQEDSPDLFDDAIVDLVLAINFELLPEEMVGDVQWFIAKLMSFDREDRPSAVEAWRTFIAFADSMDGCDFVDWSQEAMRGGGERRDSDEASRRPEPPPETDESEGLDGPVVAQGPLSRGQISFSAAGAKAGATAFWNRDQFKAALAEEDDEEVYRPSPGGGAATSFWSRDQLQAMAEGREDAACPKRREREDVSPPSASVHEHVAVDPPSGAMGAQEAPPTDFVRASRPSKVEPAPAAPSPVVVASPPPPDPAPIDYGDYEQEDQGGGSMWVGVVVVLVLLLCSGTVVLGGGTYWFYVMNTEDAVDTSSTVGTDAPPLPQPVVPVPVAPPVPAAPEPAPVPSPRPVAPTPTPTPVPVRPAPAPTRPSPAPARPTPAPVRPTPRPAARPAPAPAPAPVAPEPVPSSGPAKVSMRSNGRGTARCGNLKKDFDGPVSMTFDAAELPVTCLVTIEGARSVFQVYGTGSVECNLNGGAVTCTPAEVR